MDSNNINKENDSKKITFILVAILVLMLTTTGGTYAFFALTQSNTTSVNGTAATASLTLTVTEQTLGGTSSGTTKTGVMVPQLETYLGNAMGTNYKCVDTNGNTVCKVYAITVTNTSSAAVKVDGYITFSSSTFTNLKWRRTTDAITLGSFTTNAATHNSKQALVSDVPLAKTNGSQTYYIVIWIQEMSVAQQSSDRGNFTATVNFEGDNGTGITSTITSNT